MHFRKREINVTGMVCGLLLIFALLFLGNAAVKLKGFAGTQAGASSNGKVPSQGENISSSEVLSPSEEVSSEDGGIKQDYTDIFSEGYDIRQVDTSCPVAVPSGFGAVSEETRRVEADHSSADSLASLTDKSLAGINFDIDGLLNSYPVTPSSGTPTVVIYHTHTSEGYEKNQVEYYSSGKSGEAESFEDSVAAVGEALKTSLEKYGINVIHITDSFDSPSRSGSFKRSAAAVEKTLKSADNVSLVIDLHRGTVQRTGGDRVKPTVYANGMKAAQISLIACCDKDGSLGCPDWEEKLALSLSLQRELCRISPLLALPVSLEAQKYNLDLPYPCVMAEIGTDVNTAEEAKLSAVLFADAIASLISVS